MFSTKRFGKVAVIAGGPSSEKAISIESGRAVYDALRCEGCDVEWLQIGSRDIKESLRNTFFDIAFIALHGRFGEDGTIQRILESMSIPYTGSGAIASRLALDKIASRKIFERQGITVPKYRALNGGSVLLPEGFLLPVVVKPQSEGSSIGLSLVENKIEFKKACEKAFKYGSKIIVEKFIKGREITVGILDKRPLPVVEILPKRTFYDFEAKYKDHRTGYRVPAPLPNRLYKRAQVLGLASHNALNCSDFSRVDMLLGEDNNIYVLEVNSIPGFTERSLLPKAARAAGIDFNKLCIKLLQLAIKNKGKKK